MNWQPIETAPKDGGYVLCYGRADDDNNYAPRAFTTQYTNELNGGPCEWHWQFAWFDSGYYGKAEPTRWQPLPEPPA